MIPSIDPGALREAHWYQFAVRFVLGGTITVCTGLAAQHWGPLVGGLFLSFPAIFPASSTLLEQQQTERKRRMGIHCRQRGRKAAALDAAGAVLGGFALLAFSIAAWLALPAFAAAWALSIAGASWLVVAVSLWWLRRKL
jgi:hypothetical protein